VPSAYVRILGDAGPKAEPSAAYEVWKKASDEAFAAEGTLTTFPKLPRGVKTCRERSCALRKGTKDGTSAGNLDVCIHDVEKLLRGSGCYSVKWLKAERVKWHPDQFARRCADGFKEVGVTKATEMFALLGGLVDKESRKGD